MALPISRKRQQSRLGRVAKALALAELVSASSRTARKSAKALGGHRPARGTAGRRAWSLLALPAALAGFAALRRRSRGGHEHDHHAQRPLGPVATPEAVSPPATGDALLTDAPAGAVNPPVGPAPTTAR